MGVQSVLSVFALFFLLAVSSASPGKGGSHAKVCAERSYMSSLSALNELLALPQVPERDLVGNESFFRNLKRGDGVLKFSWNNCGSSDDPVQIHSLSVLPDPIHVPGDIQISFDLSSTVDVTEPLELVVEIKKKVVLWWVIIPCVSELGSCDYGDFCTKLPATCPPSFVTAGVPCNCPFAKGEYKMTDGTVNIPELSIPSWLTNGDYKVQLEAKNPAGDRLFCLALELTMK